MMLRLVSGGPPRPADRHVETETEASARMLQHWTRAIVRNHVLRGVVVWPQVQKQDSDRRERNTG